MQEYVAFGYSADGYMHIGQVANRALCGASITTETDIIEIKACQECKRLRVAR